MDFYIKTLGCARNQVDSGVISRHLIGFGFRFVKDPVEARLIIVNTCSFIESSIIESVESILELAELKKKRDFLKLIVVGCLPERFRNKIIKLLPEVDFFFRNWRFF